MSKKVIREGMDMILMSHSYICCGRGLVTQKKLSNGKVRSQSIDKPNFNNSSEKEFSPQSDSEHYDGNVKVETGQHQNENVKIQCTEV